MKKLSNTGAELKKALLVKKRLFLHYIFEEGMFTLFWTHERTLYRQTSYHFLADINQVPEKVSEKS